ncbi:uncharacterized protein LOC132732994 [Ruditapes philippinarum]|uniref:uncharacterized protein LOC132732994 n=1 Tax=Ruditapes philippinarum TaxID=129788 RepID=UPI00295BAEEB|nr:uncharacterized protein LOC132732994 [Ruditapes philippinarum]
MTGITIAVLVLTAIALTTGEVQTFRQNVPTFMTGIARRSVKERLSVQPPPMPGLNLNAWLGPWFHQFHKAPCSWAISEDFSDYTQLFVPDGNVFLAHESMRNRNVCNKMTSILTLTGPGKFSVNDIMGDNFSGKMVIVATDYQGFTIDWGCAKWSTLDQRCADPSLYIKTRQRQLSQDIVGRIESALQNIFGISLNELIRISHARRKSSLH